MSDSIIANIEGKIATGTLQDVMQKQQQIGELTKKSKDFHEESLKKALKDPKASKEDMAKAISLQNEAEKIVENASDEIKVLKGWKQIAPDQNQKPEEN